MKVFFCKFTLFITIMSIFFTGCGKKVVYEKPTIKIINESRKEVKILIKHCEEIEASYIAYDKILPSLKKVAMNSNLSNVLILNLEAGCYDVKAIGKTDEKLVGIQTQMQIPPEVLWVLK